jgi:hypothetical protein
LQRISVHAKVLLHIAKVIPSPPEVRMDAEALLLCEACIRILPVIEMGVSEVVPKLVSRTLMSISHKKLLLGTQRVSRLVPVIGVAQGSGKIIPVICLSRRQLDCVAKRVHGFAVLFQLRLQNSQSVPNLSPVRF